MDAGALIIVAQLDFRLPIAKSGGAFGFSSFRAEQTHARGGGGPRQKYTEEND